MLLDNVFLSLIFSGLLCHCDICEKNNNTCETDGVCAATLYKESGKIRTSYR